MIRLTLVINITGFLLILLSFFMPMGIIFSLYYGDQDIVALLASSVITALSGFIMWLVTGGKRHDFNQVRKRDGYVIVFLSWILISAFGALPYIVYGSIPSFTDAFFETMSGFTTTGASILNNIENMPHGLLFWRSMTHWLGGMGIIVLTLAVLPLLGVSGAQLFGAESSAASTDKIHPHVQGTAKRLWGIYALLTILQALLLFCGGMSVFDAICHAFGTLSTGGFSTRQDSIAAWDSAYIQYVIIIFMFLGGTNFSMHYFIIHGRLRQVFRDEEFRFYFSTTAIVSILMAVVVFSYTPAGVEQSFRDASFQVVSLITSTGFVSANYETWAPFTPYIFLLLMFTGASAGSTTGAIKMIRLLLLVKASFAELKRLIHPNAIVSVRINGRAVARSVIDNVFSFFILYILIFIAASIIMSFEPAFAESPLHSALSAVASTLGCMGPGLGVVGPVNNYALVSDGGKWLLSLMMMLGRLEIYTVFIIFTPSFWRV
ncbi:MAG: TrkH family potassium uptake protein [Leptospiraceae bacterium]|nr:TrkH family potassium uptake protein [Leptospiraceae bacterium]